jgi:hypothetical protein
MIAGVGMLMAFVLATEKLKLLRTVPEKLSHQMAAQESQDLKRSKAIHTHITYPNVAQGSDAKTNDKTGRCSVSIL